MVKTKMRNAEIDIWKAVLAVLVIIVHSHGINPANYNEWPYFSGMGLRVEGFLIISGLFMAKMHTGGGTCVLEKWIHAFAKIFCFVAPVVLIHYVAMALVNHISLHDYFVSLLYSLYEIFPLRVVGCQVATLWYIAAFFVCYPLFMFTLSRHRDFMLNALAPLSALLIYAYMLHFYKTLDCWYKWAGLCYMGVFRAWAGLCMGALS